MKNFIISTAFILTTCILYIPVDLNAQGRSQEGPGRSGEAPGRSNMSPGRNGEAPGRNKGAAGVPIDGGASALLAAGAAYGLKKLIDSRKQRKQTE